MLEVLIPNSDPKIHFWANLDRKSQSCLFFLKLGTHDISRMLILIPTLVFWISKPNPFLGKFGPKKSKLSILAENGTEYLDDADSYSDINLINFQPWIHFWANLGRRIQSCRFWLKIGTRVISRILILISILVFWISKSKSIFGQSYAQEVELPVSSDVVAHRISRMLICFIWNL